MKEGTRVASNERRLIIGFHTMISAKSIFKAQTLNISFQNINYNEFS